MKIKFHRCGTSKNQYRHFQAAFVVIDFLDYAVKIVEWPIHYADHLTRLEKYFRSRLVDAFLNAVQNGIGFFLALSVERPTSQRR